MIEDIMTFFCYVLIGLVCISGMYFLVHSPDIKGYIIVDKEVIVCKNTKYFKQEKDMIRCHSVKGNKHLVTGKFEFLKGVEE